VRTKLRRMSNYLGLCLVASCLAWLSGCGSGSSANVVSVSVSPASTTVIVSQALTLTASVSGATNTNVTWMCQYTTTTVSGTTSTTSALQACNSDTGNIPANSTNATVTFTAPSAVPDPTKYPLLLITITATSAQDTKKTGKASIAIDSGIFVTLTPSTASVPIKEQQKFFVTLTNDLKNQGVTWLVTQATPTTTIPYPSLASCSAPGKATDCGSIDSNGVYTAPSTVPVNSALTSPASVTVVVTSKSDFPDYRPRGRKILGYLPRRSQYLFVCHHHTHG
jgi:hypothetical protein